MYTYRERERVCMPTTRLNREGSLLGGGAVGLVDQLLGLPAGLLSCI